MFLLQLPYCNSCLRQLSLLLCGAIVNGFKSIEGGWDATWLGGSWS